MLFSNTVRLWCVCVISSVNDFILRLCVLWLEETATKHRDEEVRTCERQFSYPDR